MWETDDDGRCLCPRDAERDSAGKHPYPPHGLNDATTDEARVRRWWQTWPGRNIGIVTGAASGLVVLDLDGEEGTERLTAALGEWNEELPATLTSETPGGGMHMLFASDSTLIRSSVGAQGNNPFGRHVDVRAGGGYIVVAPSTRGAGRAYRWVNEGTEPAPLPTWLHDRLTAHLHREAEELPRGRIIPEGEQPTKREQRYVARMLEGCCGEVAAAQEGQRHVTLISRAARVGCFVAGRVLDADTARERLTRAARSTGLDEHETARVIADAFRWVSTRPAGVPESDDGAAAAPSSG